MASPRQSRQSRTLKKTEIFASMVPLIEFAAATGLLRWDAWQLGDAMNCMFPDHFREQADLAKRIEQAQADKRRTMPV